MNEVELAIEKAISNDIEIPDIVNIKINRALKNKRKHKYDFGYYLSKTLSGMVAMIIISMTGIAAYGLNGGTIGGRPVFDVFGIKYSDRYSEYKEEVENQAVTYNETTIKLVSVLSTECLTTLEFDITFSDEDKEYLRLGKPLLSEDNYKDFDEMFEIKSSNYTKETLERIENEARTHVNGPRIIFGDKDQGDLSISNYVFMNINGKEVTPKCLQSCEEITENEYKVYVVCILTDDMIGENEDYDIKLSVKGIENGAKFEGFDVGKELILTNIPSNRKVKEIEGEFAFTRSQKNINMQTSVLQGEYGKSKFHNITHTVTKVSVTPIYTIIKVNKEVADFTSRWEDDNIEWFPLTKKYKITDSDGRELASNYFETKVVATYKNGKTEEWAPGDIPFDKKFNKTTKNSDIYIIVENTSADKIYITPIEKCEENRKSVDIEMDTIEIDLKNQ